VHLIPLLSGKARLSAGGSGSYDQNRGKEHTLSQQNALIMHKLMYLS